MNCLQMRGVGIAYGDKQVVTDVSLAVKKGQIVGIVGESGSGKSTLLKSVMGFLGSTGHITAGNIVLNGKDITSYKEKNFSEIRGTEVGMIFQNPEGSFDPNQKLGNQFYESMKAHLKISKKEALKVAEKALLELGFMQPARVLLSYPFQLSGGMNQRVAIAMAMMKKPNLLLADEPTSALDVTVQKETLQVLKRLCKEEGTAMLLVTHNMGVVRFVADEIVVMYQGEVVEYGKTQELFTCPKHSYTKALIENIPKLRKDEVWSQF